MLPVALAVAMSLAAPVPADKPASPKPRAKLLGTLKVHKRIDEAVLLADGKHAVLAVDGKGVVIPREQFGDDAKPKGSAEFDIPTGDCKFGITPDGTEVYAVAAAGTRLNAETRLVRWPVKELLAGTAKGGKVVTLEADNPSAVAFAADGKSLYAAVRTARPGVVGIQGQTIYDGRLVRIDAKTGDASGDAVPMPDDPGGFEGAAVHPAGRRVYAQYHRNNQSVVRCVDAATGKEKWEQVVEGNAPQPGGGQPLVSPSGKVLAVVCCRRVNWVQKDNPGQPPQLQPFNSFRPMLLDAETGDTIADLGSDNNYSCGLGGFSADGKLLFGWTNRYGTMQYTVWETATGKPLKTWERGTGDVSAFFAPTGHDLLVVEREAKPVYGTDQHGNRTTLRTDYTSTVGLWDLGPLVK